MQVELRQGYVKDAARLLAGAGVNKIVSSLVFHHLTIGEKRAAMEALFAALPAGGELHIADFTMRLVYRIIEAFAGDGNTRLNGDILPRLMGEAGFVAVRETRVIPTVIGSISLYCGTCPPNLLACREASERAYEMPPRASVDGMDPKVREANEQQLRVCFTPPQCNFTIRRVTANARRVRQARSIGKISPQVRQPDLIPKNSSSQTFRSTTLTRVESSTNGYAITEFAYQQGS